MLHWLQIPKAVIGIETNKPEAIRVLTEKTKSEPEIQIFSLPTTYPQGAEKVLIYHTLGRTVMEGQLPADQGVIVMNVSSVAFLSRYLKTGMPMVQRMVTVDGDAVGKPCNVMVPMGTPVQDVLDFAQCDMERAKKVLYGGPMMGMAQYTADIPVAKGTGAILAFCEKEEQTVEHPQCIRCGKCVAACPVHLEPLFMYQYAEKGMVDELNAAHIMDCMECGACAYACPARMHLTHMFKTGKQLVKNKMAADKAAAEAKKAAAEKKEA